MQQNTQEIFNHTIDTLSRRVLRRFGQKRMVIIITLFSILLSLGLTTVAIYFTENISWMPALAIATIVPGIVAPFVSWTLVGLFIKLETMERQLRHLATYDTLTTLLSRQAFYHDAQNWLNLTKREHYNIAVIMLDIDHFKAINDTYGHAVGDRVLTLLGTFLKKHIREIDIAGRLGGEEFAILFWNISSEEAQKRAETLRHAIEKLSFIINDTPLHFTVSMGITFYLEESNCDLPQLLKEADLALYRAKADGRNRVVAYTSALSTPKTLS